MKDSLLQISDLEIRFYGERGVVKALNGVNLNLRENEVLGVVGESGCGKSLTSRAIVQLLPSKTAIITNGEIIYKGQNLLQLTKKEIQKKIRGREIAFIFQDPTASLNPLMTVGKQIREAINVHLSLTREETDARVIETLEEVGMPEPDRIAKTYPHELSGGMQQRVMIAMGLACESTVLIADEPTTALDVTIQGNFLNLLQRLQQESSLSSIIFITHDLGVVSYISDSISVMYAGTVCEYAENEILLTTPSHPYTIGLFRALPHSQKSKDLESISGSVPDMLEMSTGCLFEPRCPYSTETCEKQRPELEQIEENHFVACHHWDKIEDGGAIYE